MSTGSAYAKAPYRCVHYDRMFLASTIVGHLPHCDKYNTSFSLEEEDELA
jgi:hypothetical protein